MVLTFPTCLTFIRFLLVLPLVSAILSGLWMWAFTVFLLAIITDVLDGYLARLWKQETYFGACLDPIADKVLVVGAYVALVYAGDWNALPEWFLYLVCIKEVLLLAGAFFFGILHGAVAIRPSVWGKGAMVAQSALIGVLLCQPLCEVLPDFCVDGILWTAVALIVVAFVSYGYQLISALVGGIEYGL